MTPGNRKTRPPNGGRSRRRGRNPPDAIARAIQLVSKQSTHPKTPSRGGAARCCAARLAGDMVRLSTIFRRSTMSIQVTCECGRTLSLKDELEGKRIKCPSCKNSLTVTGDEADSGVQKKRPANGNGKSNGKSNGAKKASSKALFAVVGVGVALLGRSE